MVVLKLNPATAKVYTTREDCRFRHSNSASKAPPRNPGCCGLDLEGQPKPRSGMSSIQQQRSRSLLKKTPFRGVGGDDRNGEHQKLGESNP